MCALSHRLRSPDVWHADEEKPKKSKPAGRKLAAKEGGELARRASPATEGAAAGEAAAAELLAAAADRPKPKRPRNAGSAPEGAADPPQLTKYELARLKKVAQNQAFMARLGLGGHVPFSSPAFPAGKGKGKAAAKAGRRAGRQGSKNVAAAAAGNE